MNAMPRLLSFLLLASSVLLSACSSPEEREVTGENTFRLGEAHLDVSGVEAAVPAFERGLLLLHSFEYADARAAFEEAQTLDSTFAMAFWGEAMTYHHPLWRQQDYAAGNAALDRLAPTQEERLALAGTELERDLLGAVEVLYGEGDKYERDKAYASLMGELYEKHPGNHEVAAFYALSLLGSVPVGRDEEIYGRGAVVAKGILAENPQHPGALHYLIHSYDDPGHAHLAKEAADRYADVAPDAAHALHMPSHIYVALGMWNEVVASNIDSYQASVGRMERKGLDNNGRSYHALHWLMYGLLQQGRHDEALAIIRDMARYAAETPSRGARDYLITMRGNYLVETGDWAGEVADIAVDQLNDLNIATRAIYHFTNGRIAFERDQADSLRIIIRQLESEREQARYLVSDSGVPMCSSAGANRSAPNQQDLDLAAVMELQLRALEATMRDDEAAAGEFLRAAVDQQESSSYDYGPPSIVWPSYELYGDWLLQHDRPVEAIAQYRQALYRGPKRVRALRGLLAAADRAVDSEAAAQAREILQEIEVSTRAQMQEQGGALSLR